MADLTELRDVEEEALGNLLAWMLPGPDRDRMKEDIRAYRTAVRATAVAEDAEARSARWEQVYLGKAGAAS